MLHGPLNGFSAIVAAPLVLIAIGLFIVILAESCRIPVDDPNTHLELTMIHEVMVLDHSGPLFGVITYAAALKLFVLSSVLLHVIAPFQVSMLWLNWLLFVFEMLGVAALIGSHRVGDGASSDAACTVFTGLRITVLCIRFYSFGKVIL